MGKIEKKNLTKDELIGEIYELIPAITMPRAKEIIEAWLEITKEALEANGKVLIQHFGSWEVKEKKERKGRNPRTGETIVLRGRRVLTFRPGVALRNAMNGKRTEA